MKITTNYSTNNGKIYKNYHYDMILIIQQKKCGRPSATWIFQKLELEDAVLVCQTNFQWSDLSTCCRPYYVQDSDLGSFSRKAIS